MTKAIAIPSGTVFGRLTVIQEVHIPGARRAMLCRCECGQMTTVLVGHLRDGHTKSCGCATGGLGAVPPGTVFGRLTVIGETRTPGNRQAMICLCECGQQKIVQVAKLLSGHTKSCGCLLRPLIDLARLNPGEVPLHGKKAAGRVALVDDADYDLVMQFRWHIHEGTHVPGQLPPVPYAKTSTGSGPLYMHTLITGFARVDHIDHDGLNNQRHNLREATKGQNAANERLRPARSSRYRGVFWQANRWVAKLGVNGGQRYLGRFVNEEDAARAYDAAALESWGEYANPNFPRKPAA